MTGFIQQREELGMDGQLMKEAGPLNLPSRNMFKKDGSALQSKDDMAL